MMAPRALDHSGHSILAGQHHALQVHIQDPVPVLLLHIHHISMAEDANVVEQDVQPAVAFQGSIHHGLAVGGPGHVGLEDRGLAPSSQIVARVSSADLCTRSTRRTFAPSRAKRIDVALPVPTPCPLEPAPVTMPTLPSSRPRLCSISPSSAPFPDNRRFNAIPCLPGGAGARQGLVYSSLRHVRRFTGPGKEKRTLALTYRGNYTKKSWRPYQARLAQFGSSLRVTHVP